MAIEGNSQALIAQLQEATRNAPTRFSEPSDLRSGPALSNKRQYGTTIQLLAVQQADAVTSTPTSVIQTPVGDEEAFELSFQAPNGVNGGIKITITYGQGESVFTKVFLLTTTKIRRVPLTASFVSVTAHMFRCNAAGNWPLAFGIAPKATAFTALDWYTPTWQMATALSDNAQVYSATGGLISSGATLIGLTATLTAMPSGPGSAACCLMFFDTAAGVAPVTGNYCILCSPAFTAAYQTQSFDDSLGPVLSFSDSLWWYLSSTFDTFTPCGSGGLCRVDLKYGALGG